MSGVRKRVFVGLLQWNVPVRDGRHEIDQFDDDVRLEVMTKVLQEASKRMPVILLMRFAT
jgi:N-acyl-L-homoserine lactone synthetase